MKEKLPFRYIFKPAIESQRELIHNWLQQDYIREWVQEKGKGMWAWIAVSCLVAVFIIRVGRSKKIAKALLGKNFRGILCSDRYSAYQWVPNERRQICWAHMERDFRKISERAGSSGFVGVELLVQTNNLFHYFR